MNLKNRKKPLLFTGWGKYNGQLVKLLKLKELLYTSIRLFSEKCGYQSGLSEQPVFLFTNLAKTFLYSSILVRQTSSFHKIAPGNFYQNRQLSTHSPVYLFHAIINPWRDKP